MRVTKPEETMEDTAKTHELLNDLILINNDRIEGYERALKEIKESNGDSDLEPIFLRFIDDSRRYKMEIGTEIQALGNDIEQGTSISGKLHRAWIAVKETFNGHDRHGILEECEAGEDALKEAYHDEIKALGDSVH